MTVNEQFAVWPAADPVAVQPTVDVPTGKDEPEAGVQAVWMGGVPPAAAGAGYETVAGWPWNDTAVWGGGHVMVNWGGGGVGLEGEPPHAAASDIAITGMEVRKPRHGHILSMITHAPRPVIAASVSGTP